MSTLIYIHKKTNFKIGEQSVVCLVIGLMCNNDSHLNKIKLNNQHGLSSRDIFIRTVKPCVQWWDVTKYIYFVRVYKDIFHGFILI